MDLSTTLSGSKEFRIVKRGYDPDEVNGFLDQIAVGVGELKRKLASAEDRAAAAEEVAQATPAPAPAPVEAVAPAPAPEARAEAEEIHRALILAQRAADEEVRNATERGAALLAEARQEAETLVSATETEVARARAEGRADLLAEIERLERVRDGLQDDVVVLERHVDEQREVVQAAIGELQSLLDHPEAFRIDSDTPVSTRSTPDTTSAGRSGTVSDSAPATDRADVAAWSSGTAEAASDAPAILEDTPDEPATISVDLADASEVEAVPAATSGDDTTVASSESPNELPGRADLSAALAEAAQVDATEDDPEPQSSSASPVSTTKTDGTAPRVVEPVTPLVASETTLPSPILPAPAEAMAGPRGGDEDDADFGPPTEALAAVSDEGDVQEDAFLAELRKAMLDEEPLGPRDGTTTGGPEWDDNNGRNGRSRFGRRR